MRIVDARRLRGPSLGASGPGAMVEVAFARGERVDQRVKLWRHAMAFVLDYVRLSVMIDGLHVRRFHGGAALFAGAPIDLLDVTLELSEWAVDWAEREGLRAHAAWFLRNARGIVPPELHRAARDFRGRFARARRRGLVALEAQARKRGVPFLFDDARVTVGHAARSRSYPLDAIPSSIPWRALGAVPVALVTGTNGKTTTTRLVARIAKLAGRVPGNTSSDGVAIDEVIVDPGDNTGGESAREVLRDPRVQIAILETARGGLLRRGLAVTNVDAALVTNVSADHLGEHGVLDLKTMIATKSVVGHAVKKGGKLVLGADDPGLVRIAHTFAAERVWFALSPRVAKAALARGATTFFVDGGTLVRARGHNRVALARLDEVPITSGGTAPHNVKNALAGAALAWSLGLPDTAIREGLRTFGRAPADNPGRGHVVTTRAGVRVILDFGHNPAAANDLYRWARALAGNDRRVFAVLTQPGDRDDAAIAAFVRAVADAGANRAVLWERESLLRGRAPGAITRELARACRTVGLPSQRAPDEDAALRAALARAKKGDVVVVSPSLDRILPDGA